MMTQKLAPSLKQETLLLQESRYTVCFSKNSEIRFQITHREIIDRIKSNPQETELLVVCKETDQLYRDKGIVAKGTMKELRVISTPAREVDTMVMKASLSLSYISD